MTPSTDTRVSAGFTQGPWFAKKYAGYFRIYEQPQGLSVARTIEYLSQHKAEEEANARLIAAAPELFEACGDALELLNASVITPDALNKVGRTLEAALTKARAAS